MADFGVRLSVLRQTTQREKNLAAQISRNAEKILNVRSNLTLESSSAAIIRLALKNAAQDLDSAQEKLISMADRLEEIRNLYFNTENRVLNFSVSGTDTETSLGNGGGSTASTAETTGFLATIGAWITNLINRIKSFIFREITPTEIDSIVYDEDGEYGGDQASPKNETSETSIDRKEELYDVVRSYFPDENLTNGQIQNFLEKLNSEGCAYVAMINTIFVYFEGNAEAFEEAFGFSMYQEDGSLDFDRLLVDLYASMDNRTNGSFDPWEDYNSNTDGLSSSYDFWNDTSGYGVTNSNLEAYLENYMSQHGVTADVSKESVTPYNYADLTAEGKQVIVALRGPATLYNMDGTPKQTITQDQGHAMTVTGVTEDGKLIVSSWGGKYYIDPDEYNHTATTFYTVDYE